MMTDKVQKIREEVERLKEENNGSPISVCNDLLSFIDSLQEEPVSEELGEIILEGANFNKSWYAHPELAFKAGAKWQKEQMIANAIDVVVKVDAGNYPYIPQMELYDYEKDIPLAKKGDKVKIVVIKEEE